MNCIEMTNNGNYVLIGGTFFSAFDSKHSPVALVDTTGDMHVTAMVKLPSKPEKIGCSLLRRVSKKDYFLACTSEFIYLLEIIKAEDEEIKLSISIKIPHCHPGSFFLTRFNNH